MDYGIAGKRALVTGSTSGIGWAAARALAAEGVRVCINGRTLERVEDAVLRLRQAVGGSVQGIAADLGTAAGCAALVEVLPDVDILVNNLGIFEPQSFEATSDEDWLRTFEVNVMSGIRLCRHYLPGMRQRGWGRIVFVSSESALQIPADMIHYGVTKTAQLALSRGLAETLAASGVTVNTVVPGPTATEGAVAFFQQLAQERGCSAEAVQRAFLEEHRPSSLLRRLATPDEVAAMITYACSMQAAATTGAALRVDGGVVRSIT